MMLPDQPPETIHLDLQFTPAGSAGYVARVLDSPAGSGGRHTFALPFPADDLARVRSVTRVEASFAREFGLRLYQAAFGGEVRQLLLTTLGMLEGRAELLQVRLWLSETPALANLPWEYLYVEELKLHLALMPRVSLVRHLDVRRRADAGEALLPLHVLCVVAAPQDVGEIDAEGEWRRLDSSFAPLQAAGLVQVERLAPPTFGALAQRLDDSPVHVLHFVGHGLFGAGEPSGALVFEDAARQAQVVSADQLAQVLGSHAPLRLAVLNACLGAQSAAEDAAAGVAQRLVTGGTPAAVAMQFAITDTASAAFSGAFYTALGRGHSVDEAVRQARQAIYTQPNPIEWATPVLFAAKGEPLRIAGEAAEPVNAAAAGRAQAADTAPAPPPAARESDRKVQRSGASHWALAAVGALLVVGLLAFLWLRPGWGALAPAAEPPAGETAGAAGGQADAGAEVEPPNTVEAAEGSENPSAGQATAAAADEPPPVLAARRPITVGMAALTPCVEPGVEETLLASLRDRLAGVGLLDARVQIAQLAPAVADEAGAHSQGQGYDIVVWGGCAPVNPASGAEEAAGDMLTITATLLLVGDTWEEAAAHRIAQPPAVALTAGSAQAALAGEALAAVLAYYGEDEIEHAAPLLEAAANELDAGQVGTAEQRLRFHWLAGNAWIEHPEYVMGTFPRNRSVDVFYMESAVRQYQAAISLTEVLSPAVSPGPQLAALHQNLGWMHYKAGSPGDRRPFERARQEFELAASFAEPGLGALEGIAYSNRSLLVDAATLQTLCEPMRAQDGQVRFRICRAFAELDKEPPDAALFREWASALYQAAPQHPMSEYFMAQVACDLDHDSDRAIAHHDAFQAKLRMSPRWDAYGLDALQQHAATMLGFIRDDPAGACAG